MGFKVDSSFLRFVTMGAVGVRAAIPLLEAAGLRPIELERYCSSNKIWTTKVKRLRVPDLLCVRTGVRMEVRAKSALCIKMSDAPTNPDRVWDAGLRDEDLAVFIAVRDIDGRMTAAGRADAFTVGAMRAAVESSKLGPPKSASEGAERDREWPTTVPKRSGVVLEVADDKIQTELSTGRRQTYRLTGTFQKNPYVQPGDEFGAGDTMIAGTVPKRADLLAVTRRTWNPIEDLTAQSDVTRYAAVKASAYVGAHNPALRERLLAILDADDDPRVQLEAAGSLARLGHGDALRVLEQAALGHERKDLQMEAVLIASELGPAAGSVLATIAGCQELENSELRQAAVWGLGRGGARDFSRLLPFLFDDDPDVVLHAVAAHDADVAAAYVEELTQRLVTANEGERPSVSAALVRIGGATVIEQLAGALSSADSTASWRPWVLATLGQLDPDLLRAELQGNEVLSDLAPLMVLAPGTNWLAQPSVDEALRFLFGQDL